MLEGSLERVKESAEGTSYFVVRGPQAGMRIDEPAFLTPTTTVSWSWKKEQGTLCLVQIGLRNPETGQTRLFGYGAGTSSELPTSDPIVESFVSRDLPHQWTANRRSLYQDMQAIFGWPSAQIVSFYVGGGDGSPSMFRDARIENVTAEDTLASAWRADLQRLSKVGRGHYLPQRLKRLDEQHVDKFETSFEECARAATARPTNGARSAPSATWISTAWAERCGCGIRPLNWSSACKTEIRSSSPASWKASAWDWSITVCRRFGAAGSTAGCSTRFR